MNSQEWLESFRARKREDITEVEVDFPDEEVEDLKKVASSLGMTLDEYCNYALELMFFPERTKDG